MTTLVVIDPAALPHVEPADTAALVALATRGEPRDPDWRLESAASGMLKMMGGSALDALPAPGSMQSYSANTKLRHLRRELELESSSETTSLLNPSSQQFILRGGCPD